MDRHPSAVAQRRTAEDEAARLLGAIALQHLTLIELSELCALLRPAARRRERVSPG